MNVVQSATCPVRSGQRSDSKRILEIFFDALREHGFARTAANVNAEIADFGLGKDPHVDEFVATSAGEVCGFLILGPTDRSSCGELMKIFVDRSYRRRGVATSLIDACLQRAAERGYRELILETHIAFSSARRYYENHGWVLHPHLPAEVSPTRIYTRTLWRRPRTGPR